MVSSSSGIFGRSSTTGMTLARGGKSKEKEKEIVMQKEKEKATKDRLKLGSGLEESGMVSQGFPRYSFTLIRI